MRLAGRDLTGLTRADRLWLRRRVQMIFQDPLSSLSPRFTLRRLLAEPIAIHGLDRRAHWPKVLDLMARLGLAEAQLEKYPHQISGGQARRVAIARALVAEPSFLIADEPTAGLDVSIQGELLNLLADLQESFSLGILIVSHNLNVIGRVTDRVAIMYLGKIVEEGPTRAVFRAPKHPYAHALLSANPVIDPEHKRSKLVLSGEIPSPSNPPPGCRFHTRCPRAQPVCRIDEPPLTPAEDGRRYACHFPLESASYSASASPPSGRSSEASPLCARTPCVSLPFPRQPADPRRSTACAAAISSNAISRRHNTTISAHLATTSGVCVGVVLDTFRDRREVEHHRVRLVADGGEDRADRLLQRHEAGRGAADRRQIFRQAVAAGAGELDEAGGARGSRLRDGKTERLEGKRQAGRMEIAGRHHFIVVGQHQRIVGGAVELDLDRAARPAIAESSAPWIDGMQRIDSGSCRVAGEGGSPPASNSRNCRAASCCPAAGRAACRRGSRMLGLAPKPTIVSAPACCCWPNAASASATTSAPCPADTAEALISDSPSFGASFTGASPAFAKACPAASRSPRYSASPSPISKRPSAAMITRSPAPIDPSDGITGCTPAFSAATRAERISGDIPEPPADSMAARANIVARTMSVGSGSPTAPLRPSRSCRWKAPSSSLTAVPRLAPSPVFNP